MKLFSYRYGPCNEAGQNQRWTPSTAGHFRPGGCKGSFINSLACSGTAADLLAVSDLEKIPFFVKRGKIVKAYHPGEMSTIQSPSKLAQSFSALWGKLRFGAMHIPAAAAWSPTALTWSQGLHHTQPTPPGGFVSPLITPAWARKRPVRIFKSFTQQVFKRAWKCLC